AALLWTLLLILAALVTRHRRVLISEQLGAVVLALGLGGLLAVWAGSSWSEVWSAIATQDGGTLFPAIRFTVIVAVVAVAGPHLTRPFRRLGNWLVLLGGVSALSLAIDTVLGLLTGLVLGVTVAAVVHLIAGSPGGHAPLEQLKAQLADLGVDIFDLHYVDEPGHLSVVAKASDTHGRPILIQVYRRDSWEASLAASVWQRLWYRQTAAGSIGRQQRAEHEGFVTMVAERAGVPVQPILAVGTPWGRDAILVRRDDGAPLTDDTGHAFGEEQARESWETLKRLHRAGLAHGDLRSTSLSIDTEGVVRLTDFASATQGANDTDQAADRAHMLVISALRRGVDDAVRVAREALGDAALNTAMPYLQTAAFDADTRNEIKSATWKLSALRDAVTASTGTEAPPLEKLRRVTWSSIVMVILLAIVAYAIIGAIAGVGLDTLLAEFQGANWWWVGAAVLLAVLIYVGQAIAMQGANADPLPFVPVVGLQTSMSFVGLAVPASAAKIGLTIRFLQLVGSNPTAAVMISLINSLSGFAVQLLVIVLTLFTGLVTLTPSTTGGLGIGSALANINWATVGILCLFLIAAAILVILLVPKVRAFVRNRTAEGRDSLRVLRSPRKLARIAFGAVMWNVVAALVLGCSLNAFGYSANFASLILVNTLVALFAGLVPVPGNIGIAEAAITAGLVAIGIPDSVAMSTAIVYRLATYLVPAIYGYVSLNLMRRRGYL
ncbi:MAG: lysylphosphatidylglycerol synthase domain-containing protein, partial [Actinomycetota bacterium]|nr:lysylphosphatidylglycerol synthase domain-containing protein [Actinomycetota bacterium]